MIDLPILPWWLWLVLSPFLILGGLAIAAILALLFFFFWPLLLYPFIGVLTLPVTLGWLFFAMALWDGGV